MKKKVFKKLGMFLCALAVCVGFIGGPNNTVTADAATTRTKKVVISSPNSRGTYDAYIVSNGKTQKVGTSKLSIGNITLSQKVSITVNKKGSFYILLKYKGPGGGTAKTNPISIISEQQLKTGFNSIRANFPYVGDGKAYLSTLF